LRMTAPSHQPSGSTEEEGLSIWSSPSDPESRPRRRQLPPGTVTDSRKAGSSEGNHSPGKIGQASPQPMVMIASAARTVFIGPRLGELTGDVDTALGHCLDDGGVDLLAGFGAT